MSEHYRDVVSFQLKVWVAILVASWFYWRADNPIPLILVFIMNCMFSIFNTIKVVSGESYLRFPARKSEGKNEKANR